jgi:hypothetical protein
MMMIDNIMLDVIAGSGSFALISIGLVFLAEAFDTVFPKVTLMETLVHNLPQIIEKYKTELDGLKVTVGKDS